MEKLHYDITKVKPRLKAMRTKIGMSLDDAAQMIHNSVYTLRNYEAESDKRFPSWEYIIFISEASCCPIDYFFVADEKTADILCLFRYAEIYREGESRYNYQNLYSNLRDIRRNTVMSVKELLDRYAEIYEVNMDASNFYRMERHAQKVPPEYILFLAEESGTLIDRFFVKEKTSTDCLESFISKMQEFLKRNN